MAKRQHWGERPGIKRIKLKTWKQKTERRKQIMAVTFREMIKDIELPRRWRSNWSRLRFRCPSVDGSASTVASLSNYSIDLCNRFLHKYRKKGEKNKSHSRLNCNSQVLRSVWSQLIASQYSFDPIIELHIYKYTLWGWFLGSFMYIREKCRESLCTRHFSEFRRNFLHLVQSRQNELFVCTCILSSLRAKLHHRVNNSSPVSKCSRSTSGQSDGVSHFGEYDLNWNLN